MTVRNGAIKQFARIIRLGFEDQEEIRKEMGTGKMNNYGMISGRRKARFKMPRSWWFGLTRQQERKIYQKVYDNFLDFISRVKSRFHF